MQNTFPTKLVNGLLAVTVMVIITTVISMVIDPADATPRNESKIEVVNSDCSALITSSKDISHVIIDGVKHEPWQGKTVTVTPPTTTVTVKAGITVKTFTFDWTSCAPTETTVPPVTTVPDDEEPPSTTLPEEQEPPFQVDPDAPIELIPPVTVVIEEPAPVAAPVTNQPAFTG